MSSKRDVALNPFGCKIVFTALQNSQEHSSHVWGGELILERAFEFAQLCHNQGASGP